MRVKRQTRQCQRTRSDFRLRAGRVKKGGEQKGCFGFRNRIRVERPSDIAGRQLVSTRVLKESSQNFAEFQRNVLIAALCAVLTIPGRHFLPNSFAYGNPGCWRILAVCGIRRLATRDWFARAVSCRKFAGRTHRSDVPAVRRNADTALRWVRPTILMPTATIRSVLRRAISDSRTYH